MRRTRAVAGCRIWAVGMLAGLALAAGACGAEPNFIPANPTPTATVQADQALQIIDSLVAERGLIPDANLERGQRLLVTYGCYTCHTIPGVPGANAEVGPPLTNWADRHYIAGTLINTPENLIQWIMNPQAIEPGTAMPNLAVSEDEARDIAAYLYSLEGDE